MQKTTQVVEKLQKPQKDFKSEETRTGYSDNYNNNKKTVGCFYCKNLGHIKRNCPALNYKGSAVRSAPAPH